MKRRIIISIMKPILILLLALISGCCKHSIYWEGLFLSDSGKSCKPTFKNWDGSEECYNQVWVNCPNKKGSWSNDSTGDWGCL